MMKEAEQMEMDLAQEFTDMKVDYLAYEHAQSEGWLDVKLDQAGEVE